MQAPRSRKKRPTSLSVRRSSTSTIRPSSLPRYSPSILARTRSPCSTLSISRGERKRSGPPSSRSKKTESVAMALHTAREELKLGIDLNLALPVDENLAVAFHGLEPPFKPDGKWHRGAD